jgi:hypothetical protein
MENKYNLAGTEKQIAYATDLIDKAFNEFHETIKHKRELLEIHMGRENTPKNERIIERIRSDIKLNEKCIDVLHNILESDPEAKTAAVIIDNMKFSYEFSLRNFIREGLTPKTVNLLNTPEV